MFEFCPAFDKKFALDESQISLYVKIIVNPPRGARLGKRGQARTLPVQLPSAINGNFLSTSRAKY